VKGLPPGDQPVRIEAQLEADVPKVRVDPGRLIQVLLNLLSNGREAIVRAHGTGRIVVRTGRVQADGRSWVAVDVRDDGPGVPEAYIDRIFEPFFTTREEGTGYGLYLAATILKEQSGRIRVRNNPEGGATFSIWLPEAQPGAVAAGPSKNQLHDAPLRSQPSPSS
jgi:signal transduction histidine kinase